MIHTTAGRAYASQPPLNEFAEAFETTLSGNEFVRDRPATLTEASWTLDELKRACARLKINKACDESGLAAALLQHAPDEFFIFCNMDTAPAGWKKTLFTMLPKKTRAKLAINGLPPHCQHTAFLQGVCLHDPRTSGAVIGTFSARITTWVSVRPKNGRTRFDNKSHFGQEQSSWIVGLDLSKHRWMLQCKDCSIKHRLRHFEAVVSSTACCAAERRPLYKNHFEKYDVQFGKFVRRIVAPPPGTN